MSKQKYPQAASASTSSTGTTRKGRENYSQVKTHAKQDRKRHEAYARQDKYDRLSTEQKLKELGPTGSNRQRVRLTALLAKEKAPQVKTAPLTSEQKGAKAVKTAQAAAALAS